MKIWAQKNNKIDLEQHFYYCQIEGKIFNLVVMEAQSYRRCGGANEWDVFFSPECEVFHSEGLNENNCEEMTRYNGIPGYFGVRLGVSTPLGEEKEIYFPRWNGVSFRSINNEQLKIVVDAAKEAQSMGFGTHGCFTHIENFLSVEETIKEGHKTYVKYAWGIEVVGDGVFRWEVPSYGNRYPYFSPDENILKKMGIKMDVVNPHNECSFTFSRM